MGGALLGALGVLARGNLGCGRRACSERSEWAALGLLAFCVALRWGEDTVRCVTIETRGTAWAEAHPTSCVALRWGDDIVRFFTTQPRGRSSKFEVGSVQPEKRMDGILLLPRPKIAMFFG